MTTFTDTIFAVYARHLPKLLASSPLIPCEYSFDEGSLLILTKLCKDLYYKYFDKPWINDRFFEQTDGLDAAVDDIIKKAQANANRAEALVELDDGTIGPGSSQWLNEGLGVQYIDFLHMAQFCAASWKIRKRNMDKKFTEDDLLEASIEVIDLLLEVCKRAVEISEGFTVRFNNTLRASGLVFQVASILPPQPLSDLAGLTGLPGLTATLGTQKGIQNDCQQTGKTRRSVVPSPFSIDKYFNDDLTNVRRNLFNMISAGEALGGATSEWAATFGNAAKIYQRSGMGDGMSSKELEEAKVMAAKIEVGRSLLSQATKNISISWLGFTPDIYSTADAARINELEELRGEEEDQPIFYPNDFMVMKDADDDVLLTFADKMVDLMYDFFSAVVSGILTENDLKREQAETLSFPSEPGAGIDDKVGYISSQTILLILSQIYGIDIANEKDPLRAVIINQQPGKCLNSKTGEKSRKKTRTEGKTKGGKDNKANNLDLLSEVDLVNSYFLTNYKEEDKEGYFDRPRISEKAEIRLKSADNGIPPSFYDKKSKYKYDFCPAFEQDKKSKSTVNGIVDFKNIGDEDGKGYVKNTFILDAVKAYINVNENINWVLSPESCTLLVDVTDYLVRYLSYDLAIKTARFTHCRVEMDKLEQGKPMEFSDYSLFNVTPSDVETAHAAIVRNTFLGTKCLSKK